MYHKLIQIDETGRRKMGYAINSYANSADTTKKDALADFARGGYFVHGEGVENFGAYGSPEAAQKAEVAIKNYAGEDEVLASKLTQAGGQSLTGYFEELLWNIIPEDVNLSNIQQISIEKDIQTHYLTDADGNKYVHIYMGVKSITIHQADGTFHKYTISPSGKLVTDSEKEPTRIMAELSTTIKLESRDQDLIFNVEKLNIRLNHPELTYNNKVCTTVIKNNNLDADKSHTVVNYKNQYLPRVLAGIITAAIAVTGVGILAIAAYAVLNRGPKKAFNKFFTMIDSFLSKNENKFSLAQQFKNDLTEKMPEVYTPESDIISKVNEALELNELQVNKRKSMSGAIAGSWSFVADELHANPKPEDSSHTEINTEEDKSNEISAKTEATPKEHPKDLTLDELEQHLPEPSEDAELDEPSND